jgi:tetratricopeptide (TPR) repeat protein
MSKPPGTPERTAAALDLFQRAERYPLARVQALTNQGIWYRKRRDYETAAEKLREALALEPRRTRTRQILGEVRLFQVRALLEAERPEEAARACVAGMSEVLDPRLVELCTGE